MPICTCEKTFKTERALANHRPYCPKGQGRAARDGLLREDGLPDAVREMRAEGRAFLGGQGTRVARVREALRRPPAPAEPDFGYDGPGEGAYTGGVAAPAKPAPPAKPRKPSFGFFDDGTG